MENTMSISLPCLRGKMGDTFFYSTLMSMEQVSLRIKLPEEIDQKYSSPELKLGDWIQRKIQKDRIANITNYLKTQDQRFFNSIIVGIFDGSPSWQDINIKNPELTDLLNEETISYLNRTFGILTLSGDESLFAIDGQHRVIGIREAVRDYKKIANEELSIIFVAHKSTEEGKVRTRRLFSTLNKYAKPVSQSEIIALSEDNNCAIITRYLIENFELFKGKILFNKNKSISVENTSALTNIMVLYELIERLLTNKSVYGIQVSGNDKNDYITNRISESGLFSDIRKCEKYFLDVFQNIPSIANFIARGTVNRKLASTSLIFRPIGQNILFDVYKVALEHKKGKDVITYFAKDTFNLSNKYWKKIFWNEETNNISTEKAKQRFATLLILEHLNIPIKKTKSDLTVFNNYNIPVKKI